MSPVLLSVVTVDEFAKFLASHFCNHHWSQFSPFRYLHLSFYIYFSLLNYRGQPTHTFPNQILAIFNKILVWIASISLVFRRLLIIYNTPLLLPQNASEPFSTISSYSLRINVQAGFLRFFPPHFEYFNQSYHVLHKSPYFTTIDDTENQTVDQPYVSGVDAPSDVTTLPRRLKKALDSNYLNGFRSLIIYSNTWTLG